MVSSYSMKATAGRSRSPGGNGSFSPSYSRLDTPQNSIPIPHLPLTVVYLLQPGINHLHGPSPNLRDTSDRRTWRRGRQTSGDSPSRLRTLFRRLGAIEPFERFDIFALVLFAGAFEPCNQIEPLDEFEIEELSVIRERLVEFLCRSNVFRDRDIFLLPGEVNGTEVNGVGSVGGD